MYKLGGRFEAIGSGELEQVKDEGIARWVVDQYPWISSEISCAKLPERRSKCGRRSELDQPLACVIL